MLKNLWAPEDLVTMVCKNKGGEEYLKKYV
jgi:hypothetical protein